ncbi:MAG TPA: hypothetical protein VF179_09230 [Thermoanaerobaculia bacterium]|nr:hypothetical protein [Thermoanaerobaculia bacterium]
MARDRVRYRFVNEQPDWDYRDLIDDEEPQMQLHRWRCQEEQRWSFAPDRHESEAMCLPAVRQERVYGRYFELREMPRSERRKAVRSDPYAYFGHPYRDPDLAELLLVESERRLLDEDPACAADAETAEWIADRIYGPEAVPLKAFARTLQAAARHLFGDHQGCDELFRSSLDVLGECPAPMPWAYFFRTLSRVRERQGRLSEAAAWLAQARDLYRGAFCFGCRDSEQWCLRRLARLHLRLNEPDRALAALAQVETGEDSPPEVEAEILLGQAACLAAFNLAEPARALLRASRDRRRWIWYSWHRLPLEWWDARIVLHLGDLEDAIPRFDAVRRQHLHYSHWVEACLASLDLLLAYERAGAWTRESRPDVFGELASGFEADRRSRKFLPFAEERAALESALRDAAGRLGREGIPEARACQAFLDRVQSLPPARSRAALLFGQSGRRRRTGSASDKLTRKELMRMYARSAHSRKVRFIDECRAD